MPAPAGALAALGYGGSSLALRRVPHARATVAAATDGDSPASAWWSDTVGYIVDDTPAAWLLVGAPHSQTTFSILGNTGAALLVVALCVTAMDRLSRFGRFATPVCALGMTALTVYVLHILAVREFGTEAETGPTLVALLVFSPTAMLFATASNRRIGRRPGELQPNHRRFIMTAWTGHVRLRASFSPHHLHVPDHRRHSRERV